MKIDFSTSATARFNYPPLPPCIGDGKGNFQMLMRGYANEENNNNRHDNCIGFRRRRHWSSVLLPKVRLNFLPLPFASKQQTLVEFSVNSAVVVVRQTPENVDRGLQK